MSELPYHSLPAPPGSMRGGAALARLVDGMGFRYRWATEGLRPVDLTFRPCAGSLSVGEVLQHTHRLVQWVEGSLRRTLASEPAGIEERLPTPPGDLEALRRGTLETLIALRSLLLAEPDERLVETTITGTPAKGPEPFWSAINGPLADFLTHVGQVASWRRMAGNPAPRADVFRGQPPAQP